VRELERYRDSDILSEVWAVVGGGAREWALAESITRSKNVSEVHVLPGNLGGAFEKKCVWPIGNDRVKIKNFDDVKQFFIDYKQEIQENNGRVKRLDDLNDIISYLSENNIDMVIGGQEKYLSLGLKENCEKKGIPCWGPTSKAMIVEADKCHTNELMKKWGIPCPPFENFYSPESAKAFLNENFGKNGKKYVVKYPYLLDGKGSRVCNTLEEALSAVDDFMVSGVICKPVDKLTIEERFYGEEVMVFYAVHEGHVKYLGSAKDFPERFDPEDTFLIERFNKRMGHPSEMVNYITGGMGVVAPHPLLKDREDLVKKIEDTIVVPFLTNLLEEEKLAFNGIIYFGLCALKGNNTYNFYVFEINGRDGSPEAEGRWPTIETSLYDIAKKSYEGKLEDLNVKFKDNVCVGVFTVSGSFPWFRGCGFEASQMPPGYPGKHLTGQVIDYSNDIPHNSFHRHAGTFITQTGNVAVGGGRVILGGGLASTYSEASKIAYEVISDKYMRFVGKSFRKKIGEGID